MRRSVFLLSALIISCSGSSTEKPVRKLVILHTNDEHSHLVGYGPEIDDFPTPAAAGSGVTGGAARRMAILTAERSAAQASGADSITVSAGDNMMGTLAQIAATNISPDYRIMKVLGYDVTTLGNHEFDYGPSGLALMLDAAKANITGLPAGLPTIVASNIHFSGGSGDSLLADRYDADGSNPDRPVHKKFVLTTASGTKIGFVGIMGANAAYKAPAADPTTFSLAAGQTSINQAANAAQVYTDIQPVVDSLRSEDKVDLVVALSHSGADLADPAHSEDFGIAENVSGIDVIISGHTHTQVPALQITNRYTKKQVIVQQAGRYGDTVGRIQITREADGTVTLDTANTKLIPVDDHTAPTDATVNGVVAATIGALESQNIPGQQFSFMQYTLAEILAGVPPGVVAGVPPAKVNTGDYYNFPLATLPFDVDNTGSLQETALIDLSADSTLAIVNRLYPTEFAAEASGVMRAPKLLKGKTGKLGFADLFIAVPLGGSTDTGTPGYPICRFGIYLAEVKAAFEVTASFAFTDSDFYLVPSGFKFEYDTSRPAYNFSANPLDPKNGRVTKMWQLKASSLAAGDFDSDAAYDLVFDASLDAAHSLPGNPGWAPSALGNPLRLVKTAASYYIAAFAAIAGVKLKALHDQIPSLADGVQIPNNDPKLTIVHRVKALDGVTPLPAAAQTEVKQWETMGSYAHALGTIPSRYDKSNAATKIPRRAICVGPNAVNGVCSH